MSALGDREAVLAALAPPALLVAVALLQIGLAYGASLTPWKGGGFGMFASTDGGLQRSILVTVLAPGRAERIRVPRALRTEVARAAAMPSAGRLDRLARLVASNEREAGRPVAEVRIEVRRTSFAAGTLEPAASPIAEARIAVSDDAF